jgi:tetratricopeptide (TPR) repeat protein
MRAWIQLLLLVTVLAGLGVFGWQLWLRSNPYPGAISEAPGRTGPITGPVNGLEAVDKDVAEKPEAQAEADPEPEDAAEPAAVEPAAVEPAAVEPAAVEAQVEAKPAAKPAATKPIPLSVPTQNLPREPAKASDVLVHRALPMIRRGELRLAEATLDRAWELDPKNPQAMAGYARLYIAKKEGDRAAKWAKKAVRKRSRRAEYHVLYGDALQLQGDTDAARKEWRKALSLDPGNKATQARLAN